jgi:hypothetical protein
VLPEEIKNMPKIEKFGGEKEISADEYENLIEIKPLSVSRDDIVNADNRKTFTFILTNNFNLYLSRRMHETILDDQGLDWNDIIRSGYLRNDGQGKIQMDFRDSLGEYLGFRESSQNMDNIKKTVISKISKFLGRIVTESKDII